MWACAVLAFLNAALWAMVIPPYQVTDEQAHVSYAQYMAETGRPPRPIGLSSPSYSEEQNAVLGALPFSVEGAPSWSSADDQALRQRLDDGLSRRAESGAFRAATYPPLYYAIEAIPAWAGSSLSFLDRLYLMRVVSALFAGLTVAFVFLFLREVLPGTPSAWTVGALAVAFQPVFGAIAGGVNNDSLLFAAGAALLFLLARSFRLGLTLRRGLAIGAVAAAGVLTKTTMVGLLPGAALGLMLLWWRGRGQPSQTAARATLAAGGIFAGVTASWFAVDAFLFDRPLGGATGGMISSEVGQAISVRGQLSYLWQFYLPRLPFMADKFLGYSQYPIWDVYLQGFVGRFGWFQYGFPLWVNQIGLGVLAGISLMAGVTLFRCRESLRRRWPELCCYSAVLAGTALLIAVAGYRYRAATGSNFEQTRYLFPLLPLYGAVIALAAQGAGRRWGQAVGTALVVLAVGHSLFAMLLTINRYYV